LENLKPWTTITRIKEFHEFQALKNEPSSLNNKKECQANCGKYLRVKGWILILSQKNPFLTHVRSTVDPQHYFEYKA
jgi:hypothetical protein